MNAACGTLSIFLCLNYIYTRDPKYIWWALGMIPAALIADALDGWVARKTGKFSRIGADLDSLADIISFGVAPAVLGFTFGMRGGWDVIVLVYFVVCGISRLARFNVTAEELADEESGKVKYFEGTPIPSSVILVAILAYAFHSGAVHEGLWFGQTRIAGPWWFHPIVLMYGLSGSAMISATLRIPKP